MCATSLFHIVEIQKDSDDANTLGSLQVERNIVMVLLCSQRICRFEQLEMKLCHRKGFSVFTHLVKLPDLVL